MQSVIIKLYMFKEFNPQMVKDVQSTDSSVHVKLLKDKDFHPTTQIYTCIGKIDTLGFWIRFATQCSGEVLLQEQDSRFFLWLMVLFSVS